MSPLTAPVEVYVFKDGRFLGSRCYSQGAVTIGRARGAALKLLDPSVGEIHATLGLEGGGLVVRDNGSDSGVFVNGERVSVCPVTSQDEIAIGPFRLKLAVLGQEEEDPGFGAAPVAGAAGPAAVPEPEPATMVRRPSMLDQLPDIDPMGAGESTMPRVTPAPAHASPFADAAEDEEEQTRAFSPNAARDILGDEAHGELAAGGLRHVPTRSDRPARAAAAPAVGSFEDFRAPASAPRSNPDAIDTLRSTPALDREVAEQPHERRHQGQAATEEPTWDGRNAVALAPTEAAPGLPGEGDSGLFAEAQTADELPPGDRMAHADAMAADEDAMAGGVEVDGDDDDDEIESWEEPFSLLENVVREKFKSKTEAEAYSVVEVIEYEGNQIRDMMRADPRQTVRVGTDKFRMLHLDPDGRASVYFRSDCKGTLVTKGKARPLKAFMNERFEVRGRSGLYAVSLTEGDYAQVLRGSTGYLMRFVRPPKLPKSQRRLSINWATLQIFVGSAAFHFLILVLLGFVAPEADLNVVTDAERFAKVAVKDLKLEKPKEEPKPEKKPEEPKVDKPTEKPKPTKKPPKAKRRARAPARRPRPGPPAASAQQQRKVQQKQVNNVLSALENIRPKGSSPGRSDLKSLVSNIAAVRSPGGSASKFKVAGVIGKIPGGGVRLAGGLGGGGGKDTRVGSQLLSGSGANIGKLAARQGTGTRVRGRVRRAPKRAIRATGGILDRGAIQKVVNAHMAAIQRCYEVQLLKSPGLAGKIVFDWVISTSGGVASARQVSSSVRSPAVATCILAQIRTWRFPKPVGGSVQVRYPFVFRIQGF